MSPAAPRGAPDPGEVMSHLNRPCSLSHWILILLLALVAPGRSSRAETNAEPAPGAITAPAIIPPAINPPATNAPAIGAFANSAAPTNARDANTAVPSPLVSNAPADPDQPLRAYLKLQEQLHAALLAIEQARLESSQETRANSASLATRLEQLEKTLASQREERWQAAQDSNRTLVMLGATIVGLGMLALAFTALFHARGLNRLTEIASGLAGRAADDSGRGEKLLRDSGTANGTGQSLLATIQRLEQRMAELEHSAPRALSFSESNPPDGETAFPGERGTGPASRPLDHVSALLGKGQVLVSLGQAEAALSCYDQALAEAPTHAETHLKKGLALERLKRFGEAIACYDRAIDLNPALTQAYLCKGAVFNLQERYADALECYERALVSEMKP